MILYMNRQDYYNYVSRKLAELTVRIEAESKLNILDLHIHAEDFYRDFCNLVFGMQLRNVNEENQNAEAIDLKDEVSKITIQISATNTKSKIDHSLKRMDNGQYVGYTFWFLSLARPVEDLRKKSYTIPDGVTFNPQTDIYDLTKLLSVIEHKDVDSLQKICKFVRNELGQGDFSDNIDSSLTRIVLILSGKKLAQDVKRFRLENVFSIEDKISFNSLTDESIRVINRFRAHYKTINRIYSSFDREGSNTSLYVLNTIGEIYHTSKRDLTGDALFRKIRECVRQEVYQSANRGSLTKETIDYCADIIVVDAFVKCKIFENPQGYQYVTA